MLERNKEEEHIEETISIAQFGEAIGISRQTYCQIENGNAKMSWSVYLSLLLLFSSIPGTADLLRKLGIRVEKIMNDLNEQIRS